MNTDNKTQNTNYTFKLLYALGIIFIIMGRCKGGGFSILQEFFPFYSFNIALFVFMSGYFYKSENENNVKAFIIKKTKRLILPFYLWNLFYAVILTYFKKFDFFPDVQVNIESLILTPIMTGHQFLLNSASWFVVPLYMIHIVNILIRKIFQKTNIKVNEIIYFEIFLLLGIIGIALSNHGFNKGWFLVLDRVLYFAPFYSLGILYKKYENYDKLNSLTYFGIIFCLALIIIYLCDGISAISPCDARFFTSNVLKPFIIGSIGIAFWLRISKILSPIIGKNKYINTIADNTYSIMVNHFLGFYIIKTIF